MDELMLRVASSLDLDRTLQSITDAAAMISGAISSSIYLRDADARYRAKASYGIPLERLQRVVLSREDGLLGRMCSSGEPVQVLDFIRDVAASAEAQEEVGRLGARATLGVPLIEDGQCVGALYVSSDQPTPFPDDMVTILTRLAAFARVALHNARRFSHVQAERSRLQAYLDAIPEGIMIYRRDGRLEMVNASWRRETRVRQDPIGRTHDEMLASPDAFGMRPMRSRYDAQAVFERVATTGDPETGLLELRDPARVFEVHFAPLRHHTGRIDGVVTTMRDISMPLELERERSRANLLTQLLDLSVLLNSNLPVSVLSERVVEAAMELVGARAGTLGLIEEDTLIFRRFRTPQGWEDFDVVLKRGEGSPGHVWATEAPYISNHAGSDPVVLGSIQHRMGFRRLAFVPIVNRSGAIMGTLGVYDPVIERDFGQPDVESLQLLAHQVSIAIENARMNETKDAFLSIVSHELKTPVTSIKGFTQVLQRRLSPESQAQGARYLSVINQQADRLNALINDLLDLSRIQTGRFTFERGPLEYAQVVREVVSELQLITPHNTIAVQSPNPIYVDGNADRIRQVLVNLIDNAVKHGPPESEVRVIVEAVDDTVVTSVCDEGPGLPAGEEERIFAPYYQIYSHPSHGVRGLGLGLFITRQIVEGHHGRIWVERTDRTTFRFSLPASDETPTAPAVNP